MKLDIEALAREAEVGDSHGHFIRHYLPEIKNFSCLIVERCAVIAETLISGEQDDITMQAKDRVAAAIRQLLEDNTEVVRREASERTQS